MIYTLFVSGGVHFLRESWAHFAIVRDLIDEGGVPVNGNSVFAPLSIVMNVLVECLAILRGDLVLFLSIGVQGEILARKSRNFGIATELVFDNWVDRRFGLDHSRGRVS